MLPVTGLTTPYVFACSFYFGFKLILLSYKTRQMDMTQVVNL